MNWTLGLLGFLGGTAIVLAILGLRYADKAAAFFQSVYRPLYGEKAIKRFSTVLSVRIAAIFTIVVGMLFIVVSVIAASRAS